MFSPRAAGARPEQPELAHGSDALTPDLAQPGPLVAGPTAPAFTANLDAGVVFPQQSISLLTHEPASWTLTSTVKWLGVSAVSGTTPSAVTVLGLPYLLPDGQYTCVILVASPGHGAAPVRVTLRVLNRQAHVGINGDGHASAADRSALAACLWTSGAQPGFTLRRDIHRDGVADQMDVSRFEAATNIRPRAIMPVTLRSNQACRSALKPASQRTAAMRVGDNSWKGGFCLAMGHEAPLCPARQACSNNA